MSAKEEFIEIFREHVHRDGAEALLDYLTNKSDFFTSPASARYHGAYAGGLCRAQPECLPLSHRLPGPGAVTDLYGLEYSPESIALVALLHDVCKIGCYKPSTRNVKGEDGKWTQVPTFTYEDPLPYGHGEKSVYVVNGFVRLTGRRPWPSGGTWLSARGHRTVGQALQRYPLAFAGHGGYGGVLLPGERRSAVNSIQMAILE